MRKSTTSVRDVDRCLQWWGQWQNHLLQNGLDFSSRNLLYTVAKMRGCIAQGNISVEPNNPLAEKMDELIQTLSTINQRSAKVLVNHYTSSGTIRDKARQMELPKSTYYDLLQFAKNWLTQQLPTAI